MSGTVVKEVLVSVGQAESGDVSELLALLRVADNSAADARQLQGRLNIVLRDTAGLDTASLLLARRALFHRIYQSTPHFWYYLAPSRANSVEVLKVLDCEPEDIIAVGDVVEVRSSSKVEGLMIERLLAVRDFALRVADDPFPIVSRLCESISEDPDSLARILIASPY